MRLWIALAALGVALAVVPAASAGPAGTLDPSYGGEVSIPGVRLEPVAIAAQGGSAYVLARRRTDLDHDAVLVRLTPAGALDRTFAGGDGIADLPDDFLALDVPASHEPYAGTRGRPLLLTADGIVLAGIDPGGRAAVVKLTADGTSVVWGPRVLVSDASAAAAIAQRPDGRLVVAGTTVAGAGVGLFLAELSASGTVGSVVSRDPTPTSSELDRVVDLRLQPTGQAVLARETTSTLGDPQALGAAVVERYGANLALDGTYGPVGLGAPVALSRLQPLAGGGFAIVGGAGAAVRSLIVDADGLGDGTVRTASWGTNDLRPATALTLDDGALALFGRRVDDGARTISARLRPDGTADLRWNPAAGTGLAPVSPGLGEGRVVDAVRDNHTALALVARGEALQVARVTLNEAPTAALTATPANALGPTATITLDASGTLDPDGPTDARSYAFDFDGDGTVDVTSASPTLTRTVTGPLSATATVRATDSLGRVSEPATAIYTVGDGTAPPPPPPPVPPLVGTFPPMLNSVLTPSTAVVTGLPSPLVSAALPFPFLGVQAVLPPAQVGGVDFDQPRPRDGDRVAATFRVNLRNAGTASVCRVIAVTCPGVPTAIVGREGNVITVRIVVTAKEPQSSTRVRVTNGAGQVLEVPIAFAVAPAQTEPDYDIVGVELSQGVQRDTASARPAPPDRDAPYDGVILAGTKGEWGHPESLSGEVPAARIRVWVVAHGIRDRTAPPPELWVSLGRAHASRNGAVVRYGQAPLLSAPASVPVTPETGLSPEMRADGAIPYVFHWVPDVSVPRIAVRLMAPRECGDCPTANNQMTIHRPRVAISRMRPTNVTRVVLGSTFPPDGAALLQASTPGRLRCLFGVGGNSTAERCADLAERLRDEAPRDGEPYRANDRFFTDSTGPLTSLAPFVLGATPAGQVIVPAGADPFTIAYFAQLNTLGSGLPVTRASIALTADGAAGTAVQTPLIGTTAMIPTAIVRDGGRFRLSGLARALHLAWGLAPASGRGGAVGAARWAPDEAGYLGGSAIQVFHGGRGFRPITNKAPTRGGCFGDDLRDLTSACPGLPTLSSGENGTWISPRRWEALLVGAQERAEIVDGNTVWSGAPLPCPYRALDSTQYGGAATCAPNPALFDPRPVDMSPFTAHAAGGAAHRLRSAQRTFVTPLTRHATESAETPRGAGLRATAPALAITLRAAGTQVTGFAVTPLPAGQPSAGPADARVRFRALDAAGTVLADAGSTPQPVVLGESADTDAVATAVLPADGVARVQAVVDGRVVAQLDRRSPPSVSITSTSVGRSGPVPLRINANDPDGDPLTTTVEASTDGGATWTTLATAGDPATVRLAATDLPPTRTGRLRVTVADGFDRATATTGPLTFAGATPTVRIHTPTRRLRRGDDVTATATLRPDTGATVRWLVNGRRASTGLTLALGRLPAGRHRLTATAGKIRSKPVTVTIRQRAPLLVAARRRGCTIRLATDVPVTVRANGRRVGRLPGNGKQRTVRTCSKRLTLVGPLGTRTIRR